MPNSRLSRDTNQRRVSNQHVQKHPEELFVKMDVTKINSPNHVAMEAEPVEDGAVDGVVALASSPSSVSAVGMPIDSADSSCCGDEKVDPSSLEFDASAELTRVTTTVAGNDPPKLVHEADETRVHHTSFINGEDQNHLFIVQQQRQMQLEERIEELELKLSVLSRLLQQQPHESYRSTISSKALLSPVTARSPRPDKIPPPPLSESLQIPADFEEPGVSQTRRRPENGGSLLRNRVSQEEDTRNAYCELTTFSPHLESPALTFSKMTPRQHRTNETLHIVDSTDDEKVECHSPVLYPRSTIPHLESPAEIFSESKDDKQRRLDFSHLTSSPDHVPNPQRNGVVETALNLEGKSHRPKNRNLSLLVLFEGNQEEYDKECHSVAPELSSMTPAERQWLRPQLQQYLHQERENKLRSNEESQSDLSVVNQVEQETKMMSRSDLTPPASNRPTVRIDDQMDESEHSSLHEDRSSRTRSQSITDDVNLLRKKVRTKWLEYLNSVQESAPDVDVQMEEFIKVPAAVETIMSFGFFICVDSFLYMFTVLPIRFIWSCLLLVIKIFLGRGIQAQNPHFQFHRRHLYQLIQVFILFVIYRYVLVPISIGKLYHWIRGQSMIKLYVIIAMVEIFDRLFSSLGQDCLDSMYWNTVSRPRSRRFLVSVVVVLLYAAFHALILFVHVATLNVAMNSADHALLTLLISGNFAEIKSTVFKKYNKAALFKITAQDVCERFKLGLFLSLVLLLNVCQGMDQNQFLNYLRICGLVWCSEIIADWIKHSFISKFNFLPARVYPEYALLLAGDVTGIGHEGMSLDHSHAVVKRIGFAQIPLLCVMFRLLKEAAKYAKNYRQTLPNNPLYVRVLLAPFAASSARRQALAYVCVWTLLLILKLVLGRLLQTISLEKLYAAPEYSQLTPLYTIPAKKKTT
jgi:Eukaryotic membrane protein family